MNFRKFIKKLLLGCFVLILTISNVIAHSGRTDSSGGHWNRKTGTYHYHNSGYTPSPSYSAPSNTYSAPSTNRTRSTSSTTTRKTPTPQPNSDISVYVNGDLVDFEILPHIFEGRTLVPLRTIFEALGYTITFDESRKTIKCTRLNKEIILKIGDKYATVDGKQVELDVKVQTIKNTTFVPLRFISESANATVHWDASTETINIYR